MATDLETRLERALRPVYRYQAVTSLGHGEHGGLVSLAVARARVEDLRRNPAWHDAEVQRVEVLPNGAHRYWLKRGTRWVAWTKVIAKEDAQ